MKQSQLFTKTQKKAPRDEESINAILLQRGGFIYKEMAGVYSFLPLGLRVLNKVADIIRDEMNKIEGQEVALSVLQPKGLWQKTGRWNEGIGKDVMYKCEGGEVGLGPTHEEMLTDIVKHHIQTEKDLPVAIYQIQAKFRKESRAKSGLLRGREFPMKDLYSFHVSDKDFKEYYKRVKQAYLKVFERCGLEAIVTEASGGEFSKEYSHEFQVLSEAGEDLITFCQKCHFSQNKEITDSKAGDKCPKCSSVLRQEKSIEVGNIFTLGTKYSQALGAFFTSRDGKKKPVVMGCYGLGLSRLIGTIVEVFHDKDGIIWPSETAPFQAHLIALPSADGKTAKQILTMSEKIYKDLSSQGIEVLFDERENKSAGEKFADADLIGCPYRLVISEKTLEKNSLELKKRNEQKLKLIEIAQLPALLGL